MQDWTDSALRDHMLRRHAIRAMTASTCKRPARSASRTPALLGALAAALILWGLCHV